jgi:hypothetical protein
LLATMGLGWIRHRNGCCRQCRGHLEIELRHTVRGVPTLRVSWLVSRV